MSEHNLFEIASRKQYRFPSTKGDLTVEDLWQLPLRGEDFSINKIARTLYKELENDIPLDFVDNVSATNQELQDKFAIVKHVIKVRVEERKLHESAVERKARKQQLAGLIEEKKAGVLQDKSLEELEQLYKDA